MSMKAGWQSMGTEPLDVEILVWIEQPHSVGDMSWMTSGPFQMVVYIDEDGKRDITAGSCDVDICPDYEHAKAWMLIESPMWVVENPEPATKITG